MEGAEEERCGRLRSGTEDLGPVIEPRVWVRAYEDWADAEAQRRACPQDAEPICEKQRSVEAALCGVEVACREPLVQLLDVG